MKEIDFDPPRELLGLLADYECRNTGRRFNRINGQYVQVDPLEPPAEMFDVAEFGEYAIEFRDGKSRIQRITILYARVMEAITCSSV